MTQVVEFKTKYLSKHTAPGKLGFNYAIQLNLAVGNSAKDYNDRREKYFKLYEFCKLNLGKEYQKHWKRKQTTRKWYVQYLSNSIVRFCFKSKNQHFKAQIIY